MRKHLLNLRTIFVVCLLMSLWGGIFAEEKTLTKTWDLTKSSSDWSATGNETYFSQPYGFKKVNGTLKNSSISDFSVSNKSSIKVGFKCLQNGATTSKLTIYLVDKDGNTLGTGIVVTPVNKKSDTQTTYQYATFTDGLSEASGFMMKVTTFGKNILINGASYEIVYDDSDTPTPTPTTNTLTILPASGELKKATDVTLSASVDGSKIYYTTDGTEPTTSSEQYASAISVTKSGTTIKALAVADGKDDATAEATYTIKPDQPVFSSESKTFNDAFDVTLSLPATTDNTSKIYYAIGKTATAESTPYTEPINISAVNDGDKVILHAVVVDEYGNVGSEKYCTYTKSSECVFDFTANPNVWGITPGSGSDNTKNGDYVVTGKELNVNGVVMTATNGKSTNTTYYTGIYSTSSDGLGLRVYKTGTITFTAPTGYNISGITFSGSSINNFTSSVGTYNNLTWKGKATAVTFTASATVQVKTATISLSKAATPEPTIGTLTFKAQLSEGDYYATFSSTKDVVFTKDVVVKTAKVNGNALTLTDLDAETYEVTDKEEIVEGYYVPANTGVLVNSLEETATYYFPKTTQTITFADNALKAAPAEGGVFTAEADYKYYKLAYDDYNAKTGLGFYWGADNGGAFSVKAGTAYLAVPAAVGSNAKGFLLDGGATGICNLNKANVNDKQIYNLAGQRVATMHTAGLYIVNGKKVVVRK